MAQNITSALKFHLYSLLKLVILPHKSPGFCHQTSVKFPGHTFPESNLRHIPRTHSSRFKPQSCSQATGFHNQTSVMFPGHRVPESNHSHVPRPEGSTIKPQSCSQATEFQNPPMTCSQATGFQNQSSVIFPGYRVPE